MSINNDKAGEMESSFQHYAKGYGFGPPHSIDFQLCGYMLWHLSLVAYMCGHLRLEICQNITNILGNRLNIIELGKEIAPKKKFVDYWLTEFQFNMPHYRNLSKQNNNENFQNIEKFKS